MRPKKIALVTYKNNPILPDGEQLLYKKLKKKGFLVSETPWDDDNIDWKSFDSIILRSSWNYHTQLNKFISWLDMMKKMNVNFWNPIDIIKWNINKNYLGEFENMGIPIIPTVLINQNKKYNLNKCLSKIKNDLFIVKPTVGASAYKIKRFTKSQKSIAKKYIDKLLINSGVIIQKFMPEISIVGEYSFIFFNKKYCHSALKKPAKNDYRTQPDCGGSESVVYPDLKLIAQAQKVVDSIESPLLYARVDGIDDNGILRLMELELAEPYLFFELNNKSTDQFIKALQELEHTESF